MRGTVASIRRGNRMRRREFIQLIGGAAAVSSANGVNVARQATSSIPIVFAAYSDPVASGLTESLARPGGNVTGLTVQPSDLASKRVDLLRQIIPNLRRLAAVANVPASRLLWAISVIRTAGAEFNIFSDIFELRTADEF